MDTTKIGEYNGRDIFFDALRHKYYCWDNGKKVYRVTKEAVIKHIINTRSYTGFPDAHRSLVKARLLTLNLFVMNIFNDTEFLVQLINKSYEQRDYPMFKELVSDLHELLILYDKDKRKAELESAD